MPEKETTLFEDLMTSLHQAIDYERGAGPARVTFYTFDPVKQYSHAEIRDIRMRHGMSQRVFANYMGVSKKTVEAWECGRNNPTGPACRLLELLDQNYDMVLPFVNVKTVCDDVSDMPQARSSPNNK